MAECIGRLISLIFRLEPIPPTERAFQIIEQLSGIGGARSVGFGKNKVLSLPDAISKALSEHYELRLNAEGVSQASAENQRRCQFETERSEHALDAASYNNNPDIRDGVDEISLLRASQLLAMTHLSADICPVCGQSSFIREEGCVHCLSCGHSEC
jgi:ribonucleoside-diphosphate reductase alpha chain